jgi:hypothetical protein
MPAPRSVPLHRRQAVRIATATAAAAFATGFIVAETLRDVAVLSFLARAGVSVAAVVLFVAVAEIRLSRQMVRADVGHAQQLAALERRLDSRLHEAEYAEGYVDGLQRRPPGEGSARRLHSV